MSQPFLWQTLWLLLVCTEGIFLLEGILPSLIKLFSNAALTLSKYWKYMSLLWRKIGTSPIGKGRPRKCSIIPHLINMLANPMMAKEKQHRAFDHEPSADKITDVFDSHIYHRLFGCHI
jgi:hypothetical protein